MKCLLLYFLPLALFAGQPRYARLGEFEGKVEVQLRAGDPWTAAERNLPLTESSWLRTGASSRLEIELDEGSVWRLGPDSQVEISDYTRLSTGQRFTILSLNNGLAYFTGEPAAADTLTLVAPGGQVTLLRGARLRMQVDAATSRISVIEGAVRLSCPAAEIDIREGQTVRLEPTHTARFGLDREVPSMELDRWNEERDKALAVTTSATHVAQHYGLADLDAAGEWVQTDLGAVWKPKVPEGWAPFRNGRWRWYDTLGYTWVSDEAWGWVPYHHGRWTRKGDLGWVWAPATSPVFKPGDVYWLFNAKLAGWGPLAPGEDWNPSAAPQQFLNVNTTYAAFRQDVSAIDPAGFQDRPKEPLGVASFALALPSPAFPASRLEATRPPLRVGSTRVQAVVPGTTFSDVNPDTSDAPPPAPPASVPNPASDSEPVVIPGPAPDPGASGPPMQVIYPVPSYTGIVVLNPPEHPDYSRPNPNQSGRTPVATAPPATTPATSTAASTPRGPRDLAPVIPAARPGTPPHERPGPVPEPIGKEMPRPSRPTATPQAQAPAPTAATPGTAPRDLAPVVPAARPETPSRERPAPVPEPIAKETPRPSRPAETAPAPRPAIKVEAKPEAKADAKTDPVKKQ